MLNFLPAPLVGIIASLLLALNIFIWCGFLFLFTFLKLILPFQGVRKRLDPVLTAIAENWITGNSTWMALTQKTQWDVQGLDTLDKHGWYLVGSNHQTWADIFVLQKIMNRRIPLLKFFIKQELAYIPIMGQAWWALDFPFMRRFSKSYLAKNPHMKGKDMETTRKACEKFSLVPTSVMNFLEGTRFTDDKHMAQNSPFENLLLPKAGGIAFAIQALGHKFQSLLDITIVYPNGVPSFWDFLCGRLQRVVVRIESRQIPEQFLNGDYQNDPTFRAQFQQWIQQLWDDKDRLINQLISEAISNPS